jgi:cation diffusion facilitator family transporter
VGHGFVAAFDRRCRCQRQPGRLARELHSVYGVASEEKPITVIGALAANLVIALAKFVAAAISGSSAMLSEGIHSIVDTGNQLLMLLGIGRGRKPPDALHPLGYGQELYFWSLIVAVLLFGMGGVFSIYQGVHRLHHPAEPGSALWNYVVLGVALLSEGTSWLIAVRAIRRRERGRGFWRKLHRSKDPSKFVVFGEDSAALIGIVVAFLGILLSQRLHQNWPDAAASMVIGGVLCCVAVYLVYQTRNLIIGEGADQEVVGRIREITAGHAKVREVRQPATMHLGPEDVLLMLNVRFDPSLGADGVAHTIDDIERAIKSEYPEMKHIYIEAQLFDVAQHDDADAQVPT